MPPRLCCELAGRMTAVGTSDAEAVELTARQLEVAALVAAGRTNRQIGKDSGSARRPPRSTCTT